jgi:hypothetical protein
MGAEKEDKPDRSHLRLVYSRNPQTSDSTESIPAEWFDVSFDKANEVFGWDADNIPDEAWHQAMRIARNTGSTAFIEILLRDDQFETH